MENKNESMDSTNRSEKNDPETVIQKEKPPKPEEKEFEAFVKEDLIPSLSISLSKFDSPLIDISLEKGPRPVVGDECYMVIGTLKEGRKFWICFKADDIKSSKTIALSESGEEASLLESFLIDERKITLSLIQSRLLQRLNGQKWLGPN